MSSRRTLENVGKLRSPRGLVSKLPKPGGKNLNLRRNLRLDGMHILLAAEYLHFGGTRDYLVSLLDLYARHGARVTLVTTFLQRDPVMENFAQARAFTIKKFPEIMSDVSSGQYSSPTVWSRSRWDLERRAFRQFARDVDSTHTVISVGTPGMFLSAAWTHPNPIVIAHGYPHGLRQRFLGRRLLSPRIPTCTTFVSLSEFETRCITRAWNLKFSNSGVETVLSTDGGLRTKHPRVDKPLRVLTASLVEPYKQPRFWIDVADEVIQRMPPNSVEFIWFGEGSLLSKSRKYAERKTNSQNVHFPGLSRKPDPEFAQADIYLQFSSIENMSLSVLKAQKFGIPCVVSDAGGLPEIVINGVNGSVVPKGDRSAAVEAILRLLQDGALRKMQGESAQEIYAKRHDPSIWEEKILELHERRI